MKSLIVTYMCNTFLFINIIKFVWLTPAGDMSPNDEASAMECRSHDVLSVKWRYPRRIMAGDLLISREAK